ncbi:hypothetical protein AB0P40_39375, partial [Streptomyces sp. NPDC079189]
GATRDRIRRRSAAPACGCPDQGGVPAPHLAQAKRRRATDSNLSPDELALIDEAADLISELAG